jgi:hypothetical protein
MSNNSNQSADQAWQKLLEQLREQPVAPAKPFFYTRLQARLAEVRPTQKPTVWPAWLPRPAYATIIGLMTVLLHADSVGSRVHGRLSGRSHLPRSLSAAPARL